MTEAHRPTEPNNGWDDKPRRTQIDVETTRWALDAKVRALTALCSFQGTGKGDDTTRKALWDLADQIRQVKL